MKKILLKLYYWGNNPKARIDELQTRIREVEWDAIKPYIPEKSSFLDIGCGAGYSMHLAQSTRQCIPSGIDPEPYAHGVGRNWGEENGTESTDLKIIKGHGEALPYEDRLFEVVYSSHVLEHTQNELKFLQEAKRVAKDDAVIIIGVPTAAMAWINFFSQWLFTSHQRFFSFIFSNLGFSSFPKTSLKHVFLPPSHSFSDKTILYDLKHYRIKRWKETISKELTITEILLPAIYPYPDYLQLFRMKKNRARSSSVFFVCKR